MKYLLSILALISFIATAPLAYAEPPQGGGEGMKEKMKNMTPEEREAFHKERKAKWNAMSKEEKLKEIEERRSKRLKKMKETWNAMSDDEKITHVENKMKNKRKKPRGGEHGKGRKAPSNDQ